MKKSVSKTQSATARKASATGKSAASGRMALYASVGETLTHYEVDVKNCTLNKKATVSVPDIIQYAWPDPKNAHLYVASSNGIPGQVGDHNFLTALRIDPVTGALSQHGADALLPSRPVHMSLDKTGKYALAAYNAPLLATVHRIAKDGTIGEEVPQPQGLDVGSYPHQILAAPSNKLAIIVSRGNRPKANKPEEPGGLQVFRLRSGVLSNKATVAPNGGAGYGPRHLDFHPTKPWVFVALELQSKLHVYSLKDDVVSPEPLFSRDTLARSKRFLPPHQIAGTVHVHPNGRFVYVANRSSGTSEFEGKPCFVGGENNIAVFALNARTGEPTLIQNADSHGIHARTFAIDPSGRMLVAAHISAFTVRDSGSTTRTVPACLSTFRIGTDGKLTFVAKYDVPTEGMRRQWWMNIFRLA